MRTLIVDDHNLVREGIRRMLEGLPSDVEVVGDSENGREALLLIDKLEVELLITDLSMPDIDGISLIKKALKRSPNLKCLVLSMHTSQEYVVAALKAGACGYVHKNASSEDLLRAVRAAKAGTTYLHPAVAGPVVELLRNSDEREDSLSLLTDRQREILKLIAEELSTKEIAVRLSVSAKTVETHRTQLMERLNIRTVPGLVKIAIRTGLTDVESI